MNASTRSMDMLHGPLSGKLLLFTLPIALSGIIQQLFNAADTSAILTTSPRLPPSAPTVRSSPL